MDENMDEYDELEEIEAEMEEEEMDGSSITDNTRILMSKKSIRSVYENMRRRAYWGTRQDRELLDAHKRARAKRLGIKPST